MPLFRRNRSFGPGSGTATLRLHGRESGIGVEAVSVGWEGGESAFAHLFATYLDKALANLTKMQSERAELWEKVDSVLDELVRVMREPGDELPPLPLEMAVVEEYPGKAMAQITVDVSLNYEKQRYWAATHFKPALRAQNETVAEVGLWGILQWTLLSLELDKDAFEPVLANLLHQRAYYEENGLPGLRDIGKAPFYAAMKGAGDRVATEEAQRAGMSVDEFRSLSSEERDRVMEANAEARLARTDAVHSLAERWRALWDASAQDYFDASNERWLPIRKAVVSHVTQLDLGWGDPLDQAIEGKTEMTEDETLNAQLLLHLGLAGYLWRAAERETDTEEITACRAARDFMLDQGRLDGRPREELLKEFAMWSTEAYSPLSLHGDDDFELARNVTLEAILAEVGLGDAPLGIPAESADSVFRFGILMREADDWIPQR